MSSVAVIQTAFIGDVVLSTPLFEALRRSFPGKEVLGVVRPGCDNLLGNNPFVDRVIVWAKHSSGGDGVTGFSGIVRELRNSYIDLALIPHRSFRTGLAAFCSGIKIRAGFMKGSGAVFHSVRVPYTLGIHEIDRNQMLASAVGIESKDLVPRIFPDENDIATVDDILRGIDSPFCVFAPGSVWATKAWPWDYYARAGSELAKRGISIVLSGGMDDRETCNRIDENMNGNRLNLCGLLSLRQSAELYRRARVVLTGDSAPQHIAAAMDACVVSVFGPTVRDFGFWPFNAKSVMVEEYLECRPCGVHGHKTCPLGTLDCMRRVTPEKVVSVILEKLE